MNTKLLPVVLILVVTCFTACATQSALKNSDYPFESMIESSGQPAQAPKLTLEAYPKVGFAPLRVSIRAMLQNVPSNDSVFGCMWQSWTFGDGAVSSEKANCVGIDSMVVEPQYFAEHLYREEGVYQVRFVLGNQQLLSNPILIRVIARQ